MSSGGVQAISDEIASLMNLNMLKIRVECEGDAWDEGLPVSAALTQLAGLTQLTLKGAGGDCLQLLKGLPLRKLSLRGIVGGVERACLFVRLERARGPQDQEL